MVVVAALCGATAAEAQRYGVTTYTNADGLPQAQVLSILQDSRGYMWFGTYGGVARFDGVDYEVLTSADGLVGNVVLAIAESRRGRIFFGTNEGVTILDGGELTELVTPDGGSIGGVRRIFTDTRRGRWIATDHGLYRERGGEVARYTEADGLPSNSIFAVTRDTGGYLWVGTEGGLARLSGERFVRVTRGLPHDAAVRAIVARDGALWIGTPAGIYRAGGAGFEPATMPPSATGLTSQVVDATVDTAGEVWFATPAGVVHLGDEDSRVITRANGLLNDNIRAVTADREGNLWFGTDDGVAKIVPGPFVVFGGQDGLPHNFVRDLAEDRAGRIWIATRGGAAVMETDGSIRTITGEQGLADDRVFAVAPLPGGAALFGTPTGLFYWRDDRMRRFTVDNGLPSDFVRALVLDDSGGVWIGTDAGLAYWRDERVESVAADPELGELSILALERDPSGILWIATQGTGLVVYDGVAFERRATALGLEQVDLWSLAADWDGGMWVATNGRGAYRIIGDQGVRLSTAEGLINDFVWQVLSDRSGNVWFYTNRGLDRWDGSSITHFGLADGLADLEGSADSVIEDRRGNLWFGTGKGLTTYIPALDRRRVVAPLIQLRGMTSGGDDLPLEADSPAIEIPYARNTLTIAYAGLSFYDENAIRYRYRLLGLDDDWSAPTSERQVSFAQLPPGHYTFEVQASNARSDWSEVPSTVSFTVTPRLLQTGWFQLLIVATVALSTLSVYLWHRAQARHEKRKLERMVALRTEQLAKSEDRMRTALKNSPTFVFSQDRELRYTWSHNPVMGLAADEILGRCDEDFLDPEAARVFTELKQRVLESGAGARREITVCRGEDCRELDVSVEPLHDGGAIVGITGAAWDVTKQRELERQLRQAQKMEVVGQLAGGVAHDFNNLLTGITGYAELGKGHVPAGSPAAGDFNQVLKCAHRAADLTQQLLAFSRRQPLEQATLNPAELVEGITTLLRRLIGEDITLCVSVAPALHPVRVDRSQIEQVLANLAVNARDAMPNGGELRIGTSNVRFDREAARAARVAPGEYVQIVVTDNGTGMSPETVEHIFEPFFTTKGVGKGTGLGLATVYGIVSQHGGYLKVESELEAGSTFEILLPVATMAGTSECEPIVRRPPPGGNEVILLVEDEDAVRDVTARWLEQVGYTVYAAPGPVQAGEIFRRHAPHIDLLLTDVVMPQMSGPQFYRSLATNSGAPRVLYMSGYLDRDGHKREIADAGEAFIQKPFELDALAEKVRCVLDTPTAA